MPQHPLSLLCIEPRFPGKLGAVADWLVRKRGYRCQFYCAGADGREFWPASVGAGLDVVQFNVGGAARESAAHWTRGLERSLCYSFGCHEVLEARRPRPVDLILGRSAFLGSTLFAPVPLPAAPVVNFFDHYFHAHAHDLAAEAGPEAPPDYFYWRRAANAVDLLDLENGVTPWSATNWQRDLYPAEYRKDFVVLHPGVDVGRFQRGPSAPRLAGDSRSESPTIIAGRPLPAGARLVTFVAHRLDRLRGFDRFVTLANRLLRERADVVCVAVGGSPVERGLDVEYFGRDYAAHVLAQTPLHDPARFWMPGAIPPAAVAEMLAASDLHVYASRAYAVSQSLVEAMAAGCVVLAWDEAPVREFIEHERTGILTDSEGAAASALAVLADPAGRRPLGDAAAVVARERYSADVTLPALAALFERLVDSKR
jgi:glycosyltransferase involved in cell wall biosynthesis